MKKQRTKCFTGCWTCRSRRVKCDEEVPSCRRCRQKGVACEGYGLRLNWVHYDPHSAADYDDITGHGSNSRALESRASRRFLMVFGAVPSILRLPPQEVDSSLEIIDAWGPGERLELGQGPFGVFFVHHNLESPRSEASNRSFQHSPCSNPSMVTDSADLYEEQATLSRSDTTIQETNATFHNSFQPLHGFQNDPMPAIETLSSTCIHNQHPSPSHLDSLTMPAKQKRLIHHWITYTSRKLVLVDEPHNPCRTMMLPMALKGLVSKADESSADIAIFHAVCASAAYNLFELTNRTNEQDHVLALYHDNEAVHHLRHNLARADEHRDQSFAMAIMACIAVEAVSGTTQRWRTHVSGGLAYLAKLQSQGLGEAALSAFRQHMVKMAILCGFPVPDNLKTFLHDESGASDDLEFTFPYYGVSRSFLRAQDEINTLLTSAPGDKPTASEKVLDALELQLYLDFPRLPPRSLLLTAESRVHSTVIQHTSKAFYYAGLVFFQRSVRRAPLEAVQDLVDLGIQELESIDRAGTGTLGCLMLWPVLVLGAECTVPDIQKRMKAWFQAQRRLGFRNLIVLEDLVNTVWEARSSPNANARDSDWREVIAQPRFDVFRL